MVPYHLFKAINVLPLTFDRVNDGSSVSSSFPIFSLPVELLGHITPYLFGSDLASFALVDRDCRQLARSVQFATVKLDRSNAAMDLLNHLVCETEEKPSLAIGSCVCRLVIANDYISDNSALDWGLQMLVLEEARCRRISMEEAESTYLSALYAVIAKALPNLHVLQWDRIASISQIMECIVISPVKHLRLNRVTADSLSSLTSTQGWALETLVINVYGVFENMGPFFSTILRQAAPRLRGLAWVGGCLTCPADGLAFPHLYDLELESFTADDRALSMFLGPGTEVRSLSIDCTNGSASKFLRTRGHITTLRSLRWKNAHTEDHDDLLAFLKGNLQLRSFGAVRPLPEPFVDSCLLPTLGQFHCLTSVSLTWDVKDIPVQSLSTLSLITSLKQLQLSAGNQWGWRYNWHVDHNVILDVLQRLYFLESLAFSRDSYPVSGQLLRDSDLQSYYTNNVLPQDTPLSNYLDEHEMNFLQLHGNEVEGALIVRDKMMALAWERWHQSRMLGFGARYVKYFLNLKWCYLGQLSMNIVGLADGRHPSLETTQRDFSSALLVNKWNEN